MNDKANDYLTSNTNCHYHHNHSSNPPSIFTLQNAFPPKNLLQYPSIISKPSPSIIQSSHLDHLPTCPRHHLKSYFQTLPPPASMLQTPTNVSKLPDPLTQRFHCTFYHCEKHYKRVEHLKRHIKSTHLLKHPYTCPIIECNKRFTRKDNMKQHIKRHSNSINNTVRK
ncbi:hypothetical protein CONCODRAFT_16168 [Conidiobolus coronatus NRRL 28638]|uniref:C2H2-type domain-containing protein n=1 Tax=Conidiobolus coronatus (strain ATCC 28846 / CBS 209.66 / NRRL 28638) TaxID=796925 RepID=A0A137PBP4_CONC2|nr:hypothetical protein CONCODRAFT_16168 [Conidiobolus coronatus NRRL 28638]|eukprot:KXN72420.1 hypothetical protein CONCODRAFT_16168 [Conidiobolus coronatus NRRL 28638]